MAVTVSGTLVWGLLAVAALGWTAFYLALRSRRKARRRLREARSAKRSRSVRYGHLTERFAPWMEAWPFDAEGFRGLGDPIDGVQFTDDAVYLVEIKAAGSRLSSRQRELRELVEQGRVGWMSFHVDDERDADIREPWR